MTSARSPRLPHAARRQLTLARRVGSVARRFVVESTYRDRVLGAIDEHVRDRTPQLTDADQDGDWSWARNERVFLVGGCEFTYLKERIDALGFGTFHTFDHGRSGDPVLELTDRTSPIWSFEPTAVLLSTVQWSSPLFHRLLWQGGDYPRAEQVVDIDNVLRSLEDALTALRARVSAPVFVLGHPLVDRPGFGVTEPRLLGATMGQAELRHHLAASLYDVARQFDDVHILDTELLVGEIGRQSALRGDTELLGEHFTPAGGHLIADRLVTMLHAISTESRSVKVAVVDLDNTLWAGILREDGPDGVKVRHHRARALKVLARRGILLAVCSKNDPAESDHLPDLLGHDLVDEFVSVSLSWEPKSQQLQLIAQELNVGLDSLALFDDNLRERAEVQMNAPEVLVLTDEDIVPALSRAEFQPGTTLTQEARQRSQQYRERRERQTLEKSAGAAGRRDYLESLGLTATIRRARPGEMGRVQELLARTNQLNATLKRSAGEDLLRDSDTFVCFLSDRFGDFGLIGAAVVRLVPTGADLTEFAFSCRAMGFSVEHAMLACLGRTLREEGIDLLSIEFVHTDRNMRMREILGECGFTATVRAEDHERLECRLREGVPDEGAAPWIELRSD